VSAACLATLVPVWMRTWRRDRGAILGSGCCRAPDIAPQHFHRGAKEWKCTCKTARKESGRTKPGHADLGFRGFLPGERNCVVCMQCCVRKWGTMPATWVGMRNGIAVGDGQSLTAAGCTRTPSPPHPSFEYLHLAPSCPLPSSGIAVQLGNPAEPFPKGEGKTLAPVYLLLSALPSRGSSTTRHVSSICWRFCWSRYTNKPGPKAMGRSTPTCDSLTPKRS